MSGQTRTLANGRYRVTAKLGEGGMGAVYRAHDSNLDAEVVIKVPRRAMLDDPEFAARFKLEIRSLVKLSHPHVVKITDVGDFNGVPFAVMQFLAGGDLKGRQPLGPDGSPLPMHPQGLNAWLSGIATALDFIHEEGYIHRDVKPANILFDVHGNAYLSDFGVAKVVSEREQRGGSLTGTGMVLGTPEYMAPELIMGQPYDGRVDQYALAVTIYEILSGRVPFQGPPAAVMVNHTTQPVQPLSQRLAGIAPEISEAVLRGLAKDPQQRYPDCRTLARTVLKAVGEYQSSALPENEAPPPTPSAAQPQSISNTLPLAAPALRETIQSLAVKLQQVAAGQAAPGNAPRAERIARTFRVSAVALAVLLIGLAAIRGVIGLLGAMDQKHWIVVVVVLLAASIFIQWWLKLAAKRSAASDPLGRRRISEHPIYLAMRRAMARLAPWSRRPLAASVKPQQPTAVSARARNRRRSLFLLCTMGAAGLPIIVGYALSGKSTPPPLPHAGELPAEVVESLASLPASLPVPLDRKPERHSPAQKGTGTGWSYRKLITIRKPLVAADLVDFPVYLNLAGLGADFFDHVQADGGDIRVVTSDLRQCPVEVVANDKSASRGEIHFLAPSLAHASDTRFYLYYGHATARQPIAFDRYGSQSVWRNRFVGVWHLDNDPSGRRPQIADSTRNALHGTTGGTMTSSDLVSAKVGRGLDYDGSDDRVTIAHNSALDITAAITISAWINAETFKAGNGRIWEKGTGDNGYALKAEDSRLQLYLKGTRNDALHVRLPSTRSWHYVVGTWTGSKSFIYIDGVQAGTQATTGTMRTNSDSAAIGEKPHTTVSGDRFKGELDEVRIADAARTPGWISTEYNNQMIPGAFCQIGAEEPLSLSDQLIELE